MSKSSRNDNSMGNYYFGYLSNPGNSYRPGSASNSRSRTPLYRTNSGNLSQQQTVTGPSINLFSDTVGRSNNMPTQTSNDGSRPTSANVTRQNQIFHNQQPTSAEILYKALHPTSITPSPDNTALPSTNPVLHDQQYRQQIGRPKSAGVSRNSQAHEGNPYYQYQQPQVTVQPTQEQNNLRVPAIDNKFVPVTNHPKPSSVLLSVGNVPSSQQREVGTRSTASTGSKLPITPNADTSKLHYNYPSAINQVSQQQYPVQKNTIATTNLVNIPSSQGHQDNAASLTSTLVPLATYAQIRPSSATTKLRQAISDGQKITSNTNSNGFTINSHEKTVTNGIQEDLNDDGDIVGDLAVEKKIVDAYEDDDMDGKPIYFSRSHPEVSITTLSNSLELGNGGVSVTGVIDIRNNSIDSLQDEDIDVGLSTLPNQFCTKRDASELKKLILMGNNDHGGLIPSSSALMDIYMVGKVIGIGSYGKVRIAWHRLTGAKVAIKTYDKSKMKDQAHWKRVYSEIKIMEQVSHPRISRLYEAVETPKRMHLIMECLDGGNLCSYVKQKKRLSEDESRKIFFQILQAVDYLHSHGITHRDIKLENVLFTGNTNVGTLDIKLIDFGFSTACQPGKRLKVFCGTPSYMAPEIVRRLEYEGRAVDMWSLGILLYALLCGCFPFRAKTYPDLYRRIARGTFLIPDELSSSVKDLLKNLLNVDPSERLTSQAAIRHVWLQLQYTTAIDLNKLRREIPILISEKPSDDIDEQVLFEMEKYGIARDETTRIVLSKTHTAIATLYYLLLDNILTKRKAAGINASPIGTTITNGKSLTRSSSATGNRNKSISNEMAKAYQPMTTNQYVSNDNQSKAVEGTTQGYQPAPIVHGTNQGMNHMKYHPNTIGVMLGVRDGTINSNSNNNNNSTLNQRPRSASAGRSSSGAKPVITVVY